MAKGIEMKLQIIMILLATLLVSGCAPKSGFFSEDVRYESALVHTQKGEIYNSLEMKASIVATYLNPTLVRCEKENAEVFLIAIFISEDSSDESKQGLMNKSYHLTLNGKKPRSIRALDYHDDMIQVAPFRNRWSAYYIVKFDKQKSKKLQMQYSHKSYGKVILSFLKDY